MSCFPIKESKAKREAKNPAMARMMFLIGAVFFVSMVLIGNASAEAINWTNITDMINGVAGIMPSIGNLVVAIVPTILLLIVVGFIVGIFDGIIGGLTNAFRKL